MSSLVSVLVSVGEKLTDIQCDLPVGLDNVIFTMKQQKFDNHHHKSSYQILLYKLC